MAKDRKKALDERTRKLATGKIETGKEHAAYQEAQQQLLAIQAEQQQNLAVARAESKASFENNQTLAQAAELGAINAAEAEQLAAEANAGGQTTLNPATQAVLSKYGVGQPRITRTQSHNQQVTGHNITINNNITSNTNNDVRVPGGIGGPIQGRPLQFRNPQDVGQSSVSKFKVWLSSAFARQNEEGAKRDREYRNRENSLTKSAGRMMKRLEDVGKTIGTRMDPRKIGSTWQSQLKTLLLLFGFGYLTSNWTKILSKVADIENWLKNTWDYFSGNNQSKNFVSDLKSFIGGKNNESVADAFYELFLGNEGFLGRLKDYFKEVREDRKSALSLVKFPDVSLDDMVGTIKNVGEYLGNLLTAIVSGTEGMKPVVSNQIRAAANKGAFRQTANDNATRETVDYYTQSLKKIKADKGAQAILDRSYSGLTRYSLNDDGTLSTRVGAESTLSQASDITRLVAKANRGEGISATELSAGIQRLYNSAKTSMSNTGRGIPVSENFLKGLFSNEELINLQKQKDLKRKDYYVVARKKTSQDYALEGANPEMRAALGYVNQTIADAIPGVGEVRTVAETTKGALKGGKTTMFLPGGMFLGSIAGGLAGYIGTNKYVRAATEGTKGAINKALANDFRIEFVRSPRPGDEIIIGSDGKPKTVKLWEISDRVVQQISNKIAGKETNIDMEDRDFVTSIQSGLHESAIDKVNEDIRERERMRSSNPTDYENNTQLNSLYSRRNNIRYNKGQLDYDMKQAYDNLDKMQQEKQARDEYYENKHRGDRVDIFFNNTRNAVSGAYDYFSDGLYNMTGGAIGTSRLTRSKAQYINMMRPIIARALRSKNFVRPEDFDAYVDLLTAQSALESGWGQSELSTKYNNYSGMTLGTAKNPLGSIKFKGNPNTFATFRSIDDWANEYVEYLNRKWNAFGYGPNNYFNSLENSSIHRGQSYSGGERDYVAKANSILSDVRKLSGPAGNLAQKAVEASKSGTFDSESLGKNIALGYNNFRSKCTSGPATWYRRAGIELNGYWWNTGSPKTATATNITERGFSEVWSGSREDVNANRMADLVQPGDIMVEFGTKSDGTNSAHAQMWDGTHWLSDTTQTGNPFVYSKGRMGNRSAILYRHGSSNNFVYSPNSEPQLAQSGKEPRSFLDIFKENIINYVTSFGGMTGSETNLTTKKEGSNIGVDSSNILDKYTKGNLKESIDNIKIKEPTDLKVVGSETPNFLSMLDPDNMRKVGDKSEKIERTLAYIQKSVDKLVNVSVLGAQASASTVDAVKENTMASAQSSRKSAQAILAQQQNVVGKTPSLEDTSDNSLKDIA